MKRQLCALHILYIPQYNVNILGKSRSRYYVQTVAYRKLVVVKLTISSEKRYKGNVDKNMINTLM